MYMNSNELISKYVFNVNYVRNKEDIHLLSRVDTPMQLNNSS